MYFHVIINPRHVIEHRGTIVPNLQREQLNERILQPYRQGQSITLSGETLQCSYIRRLRILKTEEEFDSEGKLTGIGMRGRPFSGYSEDQLDVLFSVLSKLGQDVTDELITGRPGHERQAASVSAPETGPAPDAREVFVVHGRNEVARGALFDFLRAIDLLPRGFTEALASTGQGAPYIGQGLDAAFSRAHAVVVLMTPDDEVRLREPFRSQDDGSYEDEPSGQARPNVLFEAGMAMGRHPERTVLMEIGDLRPFTDVAGRHAIRPDSNPEWRHTLAKRLEATGCPVNLDSAAWLSAGDFDAALKSVEVSQGPEGSAGQELPTAVTNQLTDEARELLLAAAEDERDGMIRINRTGGGFVLQTRLRNFNLEGSSRSTAKWKHTLEELRARGFIADQSGVGAYYQVTHDGFQAADELASPT